MRKIKSKKKKLHVGCGLTTPDSWLNLDGSWNARLAKHPFLKKIVKKLKLVPSSQIEIPWSSNIFIYNIKKPLPFDDNSFSAVYASHLLEHLYLKKAQDFLKECFRVVKFGGIVRMMVPDLEEFTRKYIKNKNSESDNELAGNNFMHGLNLRNQSSPKGNLLYKIYALATDFNSHKWMYDKESLIHYFKEAGFFEVKKMDHHQSRISDIEEVETREGLCVEGIKLERIISRKNNKL